MIKPPSEYDAFERLTNGLQIAIDGALLVASHQPDRARAWEKVAESLEVTKQAVFRLAGEGAVHGKH